MIPLMLAGIGALFLLVHAPLVTILFAVVAILLILSEPEDHKA